MPLKKHLHEGRKYFDLLESSSEGGVVSEGAISGFQFSLEKLEVSLAKSVDRLERVGVGQAVGVEQGQQDKQLEKS
jgi:hypothetical protein